MSMPCRDGDQCSYDPRLIRHVLYIVGEVGPDHLSSAFRPSDQTRVHGFGPGPGADVRWALYLGDIRRAQAAGCRSVDAIARFLCPDHNRDEAA